jgi:hypothetical protein
MLTDIIIPILLYLVMERVIPQVNHLRNMSIWRQASAKISLCCWRLCVKTSCSGEILEYDFCGVFRGTELPGTKDYRFRRATELPVKKDYKFF